MAEATEQDDSSDVPELTPEERIDLLIEKDEPAPKDEAKAEPEGGEGEEEKPVVEEKAPEKPAEQAEEEKPAEQPAKQQPGTPDKVLQKIQQDLATARRELDALKSKDAAGETVTPAEQQAAERRLDKVRERLKSKQLDMVEDGEEVGAALIETADAVTAHDKEIAALKKQVAELSTHRQAEAQEQTLAAEQKKYPGVDVAKVWEQAAQDTAARMQIKPEDWEGMTPRERQMAMNAIRATYEERAANTAKSVAGKAPEPPKKPPVKQPTPGATRVTAPPIITSADATDEDAAYLATARALVLPD